MCTHIGRYISVDVHVICVSVNVYEQRYLFKFFHSSIQIIYSDIYPSLFLLYIILYFVNADYTYLISYCISSLLFSLILLCLWLLRLCPLHMGEHNCTSTTKDRWADESFR